MKNKKLTLIISIFILTLSSFLRLYLNFYYDPENLSIILKNFNIPTMLLLAAFTIINIFIIFISALGSNVFLNLSDYINKKSLLESDCRKTKIYLIYFIGYSILNIFIIFYSLINKSIMSIFYVNLISLLLFGFISFLIYIIEKESVLKKQNLINTILIFFLNGVIPIIYIIKKLLST